jgi:hypothetical protein
MKGRPVSFGPQKATGMLRLAPAPADQASASRPSQRAGSRPAGDEVEAAVAAPDPPSTVHDQGRDLGDAADQTRSRHPSARGKHPV